MRNVKMLIEKTRIAWGQIFIGCLITALFSLFVGIALYHYASKSPELLYEVFPPAHFTTQTTHISIYNARIENIGNKEAENVQVYFQLPSTSNIQDIKIEPSLKSISYNISEPSKSHYREIVFPLLNPKDDCRFSILVDQKEEASLNIEVRAKGLTGHTGREEKSFNITSIFGIMLVLLSLLIVFSNLVSNISFKINSDSRIDKIAESNKRQLDKGILYIQTQGKNIEDHLIQILLITKYRLFFNPRVPGLKKTKIMRFGKDGKILEGQNDNESSWRIRNNFLEFLNSKYEVHSRFYYSPSDGRFYHTNDQDTLSIRNQYMVPE